MTVQDKVPADASLPVSAEIFTAEELRWLAAQASTIEERIAGGYRPLSNAVDKEAMAARLADWQKSAAGSDPAVFQQMCSLRGLDLQTVAPLLGPVTLQQGTSTPAWCDAFDWIFRELQREPDADLAASLVGDPSQPYEALFYAAIAEARRRRDQHSKQVQR